ncbi:MAG: PQQ-like beta-propeller repeat protein [Phycisphaerales bacterium]|nr:PQQ-like beta-propeller repeat protein [Phycisphaerales bacterium]
MQSIRCRFRTLRGCVAVMAVGPTLVMIVGSSPAIAADWTRWGGPKQDWTVDTSGLADEWPAEGPKAIWKRALGEGYSGVISDGKRLYTMYREEGKKVEGEDGKEIDGKEAVVALRADNGETVWEMKYESPVSKEHVAQFGKGPRSTPLLYEGKLYTIGVAGKMHCLDPNDGKVIWSHDLWSEFEGATILNHGYSSCVFPYKGTVITMVGGPGHGLVAFDKDSGSTLWEKQDFGNSYSTPKLITVNGEEQLLCFMADELIAVDPANGELKWSYKHGNQWKQNICLPVLGDDNILLFSSPEAGSKGVRLVKDGDKTKLEEVWSTRKIQFYHTTAIRIGDYVYGSSGTMQPCFYSAINMKTGDVAWRKRDFAKATSLYADGKFIILDEEGNLGLATATPEDLKIHSKVPLLEKVAWTVPTLVGKTLFLRDQKNIMALDLGKPTAGAN